MASKNPTSGFRLTHVGLRVTDINRSVAFYTGAFGMKELGRMGLDTTTVVFLGYPDAANPQTPLFAREGVLELVCPKVTILHQRFLSASGKTVADPAFRSPRKA
jgi:lactoylglutathione lyase